MRKVLTNSSSEKNGCLATKLMNLQSARLLPSMKSRSETEVRTVDRDKRKHDENTLSSLTRRVNVERVGATNLKRDSGLANTNATFIFKVNQNNVVFL